MPDALLDAAPPLSRRAFIAATGAATLGGALAVARPDHRMEVVRSARAGDGTGASPLRIALVTDLHSSNTRVPPDQLAGAVREFDPDLLFVVGDSVDRRDDEQQVRIFDALPARHGKFATLGNHEYWSRTNLGRLRREYERVGVRLLVNQNASVDVAGRPVHVAGLDDWRAGTPDYRLVADDRAGWRDASRRLVLSHCPVTFNAIQQASGLPLDVFAGHTHGGQIAPLGMPLYLPKGSGGYVQGWYAAASAPQRLYVSRGLGNSGIPFRIGARPELALITL